MDLVVNHTSDEHPWFVESRSTDNPGGTGTGGAPAAGHGPASPGRSRRTGGRPSPGRRGSGIRPPGSTTCTFSPYQPDLNWENPEVRRAVYAMVRWWLDRGVDGFRMDVINMIS